MGQQCWLVINDSSFVYKDDKGTKYVYPQKTYYYTVKTNSNIQGSGVGKFKIVITNGKKSGDTSTQFDVNENIQFSVQWNDIVDTCNIFIKEKSPYFGDTLNPISPIRFSYRIASLKGQTPTIAISNNPPIGSKQNITAQIITEATYTNLYMPYNIITGWVNIPAEYYEWTLPPNWKAAGQLGSTFVLGANQKSITITPDYVTAGEIKVRALNALKTAGSDIKSNALDRGFNFTAFPTSITFGDKTAKTFSTTLFSGITYEWSTPAGWQINGQGNTLEGLNLNSVNVTPGFCSLTDGRVRVRLKKEGEVSSWYDCTNYQGVLNPTVNSTNNPIYQYEPIVAEIQSISWLGNGICVIDNQSSDYKISFSQTGTVILSANILMKGCSTPIILKDTVQVLPHRIFIAASSQICNQETSTIHNLPPGASVVWSSSDASVLNLTSGQGNVSANFTKIANGKCNINAIISIGCNNSILLTQSVSVGVPVRPWISNHDVVSTTSSSSYTLCIGQKTTSLQLFFAEPTNSPDANDWILQKTMYPSNFELVQNGNNVLVNPLQKGLGQFTVKAVNSCGESSVVTVYLTINTCNNPTPIDPPGLPIDNLILYANPASDVVTASVTTTIENSQNSSLLLNSTNSSTTKPYEGEFDIQILSDTSGFVKTIHSNQPTLQIPLHGLKKGMYIVHLIINGKVAQKKILWKK
ncbi:MAG: hypothetical protein H6Q25_1670 [Bacteroidetes bacterium]|nr:hypothetical protein [Bacteroidota bacterium]